MMFNQSSPFMNIGIINIYALIEVEGIPLEDQYKLVIGWIVLNVLGNFQRIKISNEKDNSILFIDDSRVRSIYEEMREKMMKLFWENKTVEEEDIYWFDDQQHILKKIYFEIQNFNAKYELTTE